MLINRLPQESWTQTELRDSAPESTLLAPSKGEQKFGPWALINYQLAQLTDAVRVLHQLTIAVNGGSPAPVEPTPTPMTKRAVRKLGSAAVAYLNDLRAKGG